MRRELGFAIVGNRAYHSLMSKNTGGGNTPLYGALIGIVALLVATWAFQHF